jgi:hypothetical protein
LSYAVLALINALVILTSHAEHFRILFCVVLSFLSQLILKVLNQQLLCIVC